MHNDMRINRPFSSGCPILMTVKEVSRGLDLPVSKVYLMIREGLLEGFKLGADWRIRTSSVQRYLPEGEMALQGVLAVQPDYS